MQIKLKNKAGLRGLLTIDLVYPDKVIKHFHDENMIMLEAKQLLLEKIYLPNKISDPIETLHVGDGGTIDPEGKFPKAINNSLTSLFNDIESVPTSYTTEPEASSVTFIADIDQTLCNGQLITEAGLFTVLGDMFNIRTFPGIPKTSEFSVHFEWSIELL